MANVLVTGANRGLGLALVREALRRGDRVFATYRSTARAGPLRKLQESYGDRLQPLKLELLDTDSHKSCRREIDSQVGGLDVLINSAGINWRDESVAPRAGHKTIRAIDPAAMLRMFEINTVAQVAVTQALLPLMKDRGKPKVAFLSSGMGSISRKDGSEIEYSYSASKAAINMVVRVLAHEVKPRGILVVAINPGWVQTDMGTPEAPLEPEPVATGIWRVLDNLAMPESGTFVDWEGKPVPW